MLKKRGFTLLEVLIVVIIIGILAGIALPQYFTTLEKARSGEAASNIGSIRTSVDRYWYQNASISEDLNDLDIDNPNSQANKLYVYDISDEGTSSSVRDYIITATRSGNANTWIKWTQTDNETGVLTRSDSLGGPN